MSPAGFVLFLAACVGHTALLSFSLNWWYGHAVNHHILRWVKNLHGLLVLAGPLVFGFGTSFPPGAASPGGQAPGAAVLAAYAVVCDFVALGVLPAITLARALRRPAVLAENHTRTVDVAAALGAAPVGRGRFRRLARLPGNGLFRVEFSERTLLLDRLPPAWDGLTILHLSDLHFSGTPDRGFYEYVIDRCREWEPDLVAVTGDFVDTPRHHRWILPILGRLRWRVAGFAILGNHDRWYEPALVRRRLRRAGFHVLGNTWEQVDVRGEPLVVIGNETPWFRPGPDLAECPRGPFRLCLSHTPDTIPWARRNAVDLLLAGHVHGGQIRFPVIGSVLVPSRYGRRYDCGTFDAPPTAAHVIRGLAGRHPVRYHCPPEVVKLVLRRPAATPR